MSVCVCVFMCVFMCICVCACVCVCVLIITNLLEQVIRWVCGTDLCHHLLQTEQHSMDLTI